MDGEIPPVMKVCTDFPTVVNSAGLWDSSASWKVNFNTSFVKFSLPLQNYTIPILELEMTLIFAVTQSSHYILKKLGLPVFASQLLTGLILGDVGLDGMVQKFRAHSMSPIFPFTNQDVLNTLSMFGYALFCFLIGVKMDLSLISKVGKKALYMGIITLIVPFVAGAGTLMFLHFKWQLKLEETVQLLFVVSMHCLSPTAVIACLLGDLKILNSELGRLALSSALVSDISGIGLIGLATLLKVVGNDSLRGVRDMAIMTLYALFVCFAGRPIMFWMIKQTAEGKPVRDSYIFFIFLALLWSGLLSCYCDMPIVIGPLILGLAVPDGPPLGATLVKKLDFMVNRVFMPIFVTTAMLRVSIHAGLPHDGHKKELLASMIITATMFCGKFLASLATPWCCKMPAKDSMALALIMNAKGVVEIASYTVARDTSIIPDEVFGHMMSTVVSSAIAIPFLLRFLYDPKKKYAAYQKRNLMSSNLDSELRILACIHKADNTPAIINLLDASCPTKDIPISLYVLHLMELVGQTAPLLITHDLQKKSFSTYSYSENVIDSFSRFQKDNEGAVSLQVFTAVSQPQYMYDDICTVAIDKATSLIILPFHRKWSSVDGVIGSESQNTRALNRRVLEMAPCSVGILVNRHGELKGNRTSQDLTPKETYKVALIFFGGKDDREALTYAKRMVKNGCIRLTVIRFMDASKEGEMYDKWEWVQDIELLKLVRRHGAGFVSYFEENVEDASQTTRKIRALMDGNEYDLFIVGRRYNVRSPQTKGLEEWSEFPELGVIGDMLSSADSATCKSSVLVIQQQQQRRS